MSENHLTATRMLDLDHLGIYPDPDAFFAEHATNATGVRGWLFAAWARPSMNRRVRALRAQR